MAHSPRPRSLRSSSPSPSSSSSAISGSPPRLDPSTLALLDSYLNEKAERDRLFDELAADRAAAQIAGLALDAGEGGAGGEQDAGEEKPMISVKEFRLAFGEDWQLSQFWYSETSAHTLARAFHTLCTPTTSIAFLCCPTAFVAFEHLHPLPNSRLLEFDQRFAVLSPRKYIPYDIDEPEDVPESMVGSVDVVVADPPFLNEVTNQKLKKTLLKILKPEGKFLLLTSTSVEDVIEKLYDAPPLGPMKRTAIEIEHGQLANAFGCWGSWEGAESFGADLKEEEKAESKS